jgi:cytochrome c oxidase subunit 2
MKIFYQQLELVMRRGSSRPLHLLAAIAVTAMPSAFAQSDVDEAISPQAAGAVAACAVCHGNAGEGNQALDAPRIGGMAQWYAQRQLEHFKAGIRGGSDEDKYGRQMHAMTLLLEGENVLSELARYLTTLNPPAAPETIEGDVTHGEELYTVCTACHGADARGSKQLNTPDMTGQHDWYLVRQLENYRKGIRGTHKADTFGAQMIAIMGTLPDRQAVLDVVAYINTLEDK